MTTTKAFAYLRVSDVAQEKGDGYNRQTATISEWAKANGVEIVGTFKEEVSGTKAEEDRPVFQRMVGEILADGVRTIVVEGLDRLAREVRVQESLLIYLAAKNIHLYNARTGENVSEAYRNDPMRRALIQIQAVFSELEKNQLVLRLRAARERKRARGEKADGRKGYKDKNEWKETMDYIRKLYRKPRLGRRRTLRAIAETLNAEGRRTMDGKLWTVDGIHKIVHPRKKQTKTNGK